MVWAWAAAALPAPWHAGVSSGALRNADGHQQIQPGFRLLKPGQRGGEWITVLDARLGDLPGESLSDFGGLGDAAPFCDQTGNIGARGEEASAGQSLDVKSNRCVGHRVAEVASCRRCGSPKWGTERCCSSLRFYRDAPCHGSIPSLRSQERGSAGAGPKLAGRGCRGLHAGRRCRNAAAEGSRERSRGAGRRSVCRHCPSRSGGCKVRTSSV